MRGHVCSLLIFGFDSYGNDGAENEAAPAKGTIKTFADTLRGESRPGDVLARTDEAEFALILPETDSAEAWAMAERIWTKAAWKIEVSAGAACFPGDAYDAGSLIKAARRGLGRERRRRLTGGPSE